MSNKEFLRLRMFERAAKRAFRPSKQIVSRHQSKQPRLLEKSRRKQITIQFQDYLSGVVIPISVV